MWDIDGNGNIVWREGGRSDLTGDDRVFGFIKEGTNLGQQILASRAAGGSGLTAAPAGPQPSSPSGSATSGWWNNPLVEPSGPIGFPSGPRPIRPEDLFGPTGDGEGGGGGYRPSFVSTASAEAMLPLYETEMEAAAIQSIIDDLDARSDAGSIALRNAWEGVRAVNAAAAAKAEQMAREAGPEAAALWRRAAAEVLNLSAQIAQEAGSAAGMQSVNVSPFAGSGRIAMIMAAQAPRAQQFAERMGLINAEDIAAQSRTASMMGEAYVGEIQRTALIQANNARQAHNERVMNRIAANQSTIAQMRFQAAQTNAQLGSAAAAARAGSRVDPRTRAMQLVADIDAVGTSGPSGPALLVSAYPSLSIEQAAQLIEDARTGNLDWEAALDLINS